MPRVVKRADVRRNEILTTAYALFCLRGYEGTTVNAIIDELGLSKGAFYHHFESKEEVLQALARRMAEEMYVKLAAAGDEREASPLDKLNLMFGTGAEYKKAQLPMMRAMMRDLRARREPAAAQSADRGVDRGVRPAVRAHPRRGQSATAPSTSTIPPRPRAS